MAEILTERELELVNLVTIEVAKRERLLIVGMILQRANGLARQNRNAMAREMRRFADGLLKGEK